VIDSAANIRMAFESKPGRQGSSDLSGKATIRGHKYEWTGYEWTGMMRGKALNGKYTSTVGYHGEFVLKAE
jgi:hypothetical protein